MASVIGNILSAIGGAAETAASGPVGAANGVAGLINGIIDRISPDPTVAAQQKLQVAQMEQAGHFKELDTIVALSQQQTDINKVEGGSNSFFVAGWRPGVGWVGVVALALVYWPKALVLTGVWLYQALAIIHGSADLAHLAVPAFPDLGVTDLIGLVGTLLGMGAMRSFDKTQGTGNGH